MKKSLLLMALLLPLLLDAQHTIKGIVTDKKSQKHLTNAHLMIDDGLFSTVSDSKGNYSFFDIPQGMHIITCSYLGYQSISLEITLESDKEINFEMESKAIITDEVIINAVRAGNKAPTTYTNIEKDFIQSRTDAKDVPYLLNNTPSLVASSDAGAGIGYTGFRIRGTDLNRINITMNGIPLNDAESHGVFWVNMPDFSNSIDNVQIQRGVGTSTNGAAAFGASVNFQTLKLNPKSYAMISNTFGSFNTWKHTIIASTGLLQNNWTVDTRLSKITSDGYVDRGWSNLKSLYVSIGKYNEKSFFKINILSGEEQTYQSWWGVPSVRLKNDITGMKRYEEHGLYTSEETAFMLNADSRTYNYYTYKNQTDNYQQDHYQGFYSWQANTALTVNMAVHYTYGRGYYEEFKADDDLEAYLLQSVVFSNDTVFTTDIIRQKWLDNDFYGATINVLYKKSNTFDITVGGASNRYDGDHFGKVIWAEYMSNGKIEHTYYEGNGLKDDANAFAKANWQFLPKFSLYLDAQYRYIDYRISGVDDDQRELTQHHVFNFINPKAGVLFDITKNMNAYFSFARANREPNRSNYVDAPRNEYPTHESLNDFELGWRFFKEKAALEAVVYYMDYKNQLVLTGQINDVGSAIMVNVPKSYRAGIELNGGVQLFKMLRWDANITLSKNIIQSFTEYVDNWDTWIQEANNIGRTDIAFSPNTIANSMFDFSPFKKLNFRINTQYVGKQYIDNTSSNDRALDAYWVNNFSCSYHLYPKFIKQIEFSVGLNNFLNHKYESNAWVYSYIYENKRYKMDGYFPQAMIHGFFTMNLFL